MQLGLNVQQFKEGFFTAPGIEALLSPEVKQALGKMGGYVRKTARNSLKYGDGPGGAGQPPQVHRFSRFSRQKTNRKTGAVTSQQVSPLKEMLFYAYDPATKSAIVGPAIFLSQARSVHGSGPVPGTLEKGGSVTITRVLPLITTGGHKAGPKQKEAFLRLVKDGRIARPTQTLTTTRQYKPHPFMGPALTASLPKFSSYFSKSGGD